VKSNVVLRGSNARALFAAGEVPISTDELSQRERQPLKAKDHTLLEADDLLITVIPGGGGYGDPLRRDAAAVARDVRDGLVSPEIAHSVYGVVLARDGAVDDAASAAARDAIRAERLSAGRPVGGELGAQKLERGDVRHHVCDTVEAVGDALRCSICHHRFGDYTSDYKRASLMRELPITYTSPLNGLGLVDEVILREYCCPGCGTAVAVDVQLREEPVLEESSLRESG
jgi:N-methylhydantoinase B